MIDSNEKVNATKTIPKEHNAKTRSNNKHFAKFKGNTGDAKFHREYE